MYASGWLARERLNVPVIVVGNISVGGSGKTPLVIWLAQQLNALGRNAGIISRGYGGDAVVPCEVAGNADPRAVGDEPLLLARRSGCPVWIGADRVAAGRALLQAHPACDVVIADDGLQHYRLARDVEIAVVDARGFGNAWPLPAGPLREPIARLATVAAVVENEYRGGELEALPRRFPLRLAGARFHCLAAPEQSREASDFAGERLHAIAGIGNPERFFATLRNLGLSFAAHAFPDHHPYERADLAFAGEDTLLMTEKDAVKCAAIAPHNSWVLPVAAELEPAVASAFLALVVEKIDGPAPARHPRLPRDQGAAGL